MFNNNRNYKYQFFRLLCNCTFGKTKSYLYAKKMQYKSHSKKSNDFSYDKHRSLGCHERLDISYTNNIIGISVIQSLNKIKEIELKKKIKEGKKVRVCILIDNISKLSNLSVYKNLLENDLFEPFILIAHEQKYGNPNLKKEWNDTYQTYLEFKKKNYNVYFAYDEQYNVIPIEKYKPDIVFTSAAYLDATHSGFTSLKLNIDYLVCYVNYALNTINYYAYHYNNRRISSCWKHFVETVEDYNELTLYSSHMGINAVLTGYPKFDSFCKPIEQCKIPKKIDNGKPIVIYAPHWTVHNRDDNTDLSTFREYYKFFISLVKNTPQINFVFKPHPTLLWELTTYGIMTENEYNDYIKTWDSLQNGIVITSGDYMDLFRMSDLMITDSGSFIGEWLPTDKPCMYLIKPTKDSMPFMDRYSLLGRKILEKYYLCHKQADIEKYFKMIMFDKLDPKKDERIKLKDELFINIGCAGQKIVDYLTQVLTD